MSCIKLTVLGGVYTTHTQELLSLYICINIPPSFFNIKGTLSKQT